MAEERLPDIIIDQQEEEDKLHQDPDKAYGVPKKLLLFGAIVFFILGTIILYVSIRAHQPLAIALGVMMYVATFGYLLILRYPDKPTHRQKAAEQMKNGYEPPHHPDTKRKKKKKK